MVDIGRHRKSGGEKNVTIKWSADGDRLAFGPTADLLVADRECARQKAPTLESLN
jgi:hypothetical protein